MFPNKFNVGGVQPADCDMFSGLFQSVRTADQSSPSPGPRCWHGCRRTGTGFSQAGLKGRFQGSSHVTAKD